MVRQPGAIVMPASDKLRASSYFAATVTDHQSARRSPASDRRGRTGRDGGSGRAYGERLRRSTARLSHAAPHAGYARRYRPDTAVLHGADPTFSRGREDSGGEHEVSRKAMLGLERTEFESFVAFDRVSAQRR